MKKTIPIGFSVLFTILIFSKSCLAFSVSDPPGTHFGRYEVKITNVFGNISYLIPRGEQAVFAFWLHNAGLEDDTYSFEMHVPDGWSVISLPDISLESGHNRIVQFAIDIPQDAELKAGTYTERIIVVATSHGNSNWSDEAHFKVKVVATKDSEFVDTVGDGILDTIEEVTNSDYVDTDSDGIEDAIEYEIGSDPNQIDTDQDGLFDIVEYTMAYVKAENELKSGMDENDLHQNKEIFSEILEHQNVTYRDSDNDGVSDKLENKYGFNPMDSDTDDDGISDGLEYGTSFYRPYDSDKDQVYNVLETGDDAFDPNVKQNAVPDTVTSNNSQIINYAFIVFGAVLLVIAVVMFRRFTTV